MFEPLNMMMISFVTVILFSVITAVIFKITKELSSNSLKTAILSQAKVLELNRGFDRKGPGIRLFNKRPFAKCFALFELEGGELKEFLIPSKDYKYMSEGDEGNLLYSENNYINFSKKIKSHMYSKTTLVKQL